MVLPPRWALYSGTRMLEPIQIEIRNECHFKAKPCGLCGLPKSNRVHTPKKTATCRFKRQNGCAACGRNKGDRAHLAPVSFNVLASGQGSGNVHIYDGAKSALQAAFVEELRKRGPMHLARVYAEGEIVFPDNSRPRDQGNFRVIPEKALGDALIEAGWLDNDDWDHYEFGGLTKAVEPGASATRVTLFPVEEDV